ncbi:glycosyltransferase [Ekhidna sp.]|uniref:glycosyltransferase n=1 Tax=Ekhidna sp. TaxID=2608089 RepID=UPI00329A5DBE
MNIFIVPSWYPSKSNPSYGIFVKEQITLMAKSRPDWKIGVSTWGQGDHEKLIWVKDHFRNLQKFNKHGLDKATVMDLPGFKEYYQPALSWTKKFRKGNLREIIRCNELNYQAHALENGKPDIISVQACYPGVLIANYLAKKYDVAVHLHVRLGGFMFEKMLNELGSMKADLLSAIAGANLITATSNFHREQLKKWIPNASTFYNPVDIEFFQIGDNHKDYAIAIGRLEQEKGFDLLIDAIAKVPDLKVKIVGSGSEKNKLKNRIDALGLRSRVSLLGEASREEVKDLIQKCQFLILPSTYETFGNVLLEAMACGKPVVATKCGGPEEIVSPESGYLAEISADDLSDKIHQMLQNRHLFKAENIRKITTDHFSSNQWITKLEFFFREIS